MAQSDPCNYETLVNGRYERSQISACFKDSVQSLPGAFLSSVETKWQMQLSAAEATGRTLFDGEMLRLDSFTVRAGAGERTALELSLSKTRYKNFVGTNMALPRSNVRIPVAQLANPLGLSALVICSDSTILLGLRGKGTFLYSGYWHTFGGTADPGDVDERGNVSLFDVMARELEEELGITSDETIALHCIGLVRDLAILQPELIFRVHVTPSSVDIIQRIKAATPQSSDEHDRLVTFENTPEAVARFLDDHAVNITPVALAVLTRHFSLTSCEPARER